MTDGVLTLNLPQVRASLKASDSDWKLFVLGGRAPSPSWLADVAEGREVWAIDSGADACMAADVMPARLVGDFDSVSKEAYNWACSHGAKVESYDADKDDTDFQLAMSLTEGNVVVTGCWGSRFDHVFSSLFSAVKNEKRGLRILCFADSRDILFPIHGLNDISLEFYTSPTAISLLPMTQVCEGVCAEGVKWPLKDAMLEQAYPWAVSNVRNGRLSSFKLKSGVLGVYAVWED